MKRRWWPTSNGIFAVLAADTSFIPSGMVVEMGFSTRTGMPASIRSSERETCVELGVHSIAASGGGWTVEDRRVGMEG